MLRKIALVSLLVFGALAYADDEVDAQAHAVSQVESFHVALLQAMQLPDYAARETLLSEKVVDLFDVPRVASISLGRTWRELDAAAREDFQSVLQTLIVATYADRFSSYSGQQFVTDEVKPVRTGFVVRTHLTRENEEDVSLDYFLREDGVFNVVADGVSDLSLRRADYSSIVKSQGYPALLVHLQQKIDAAQSGDS